MLPRTRVPSMRCQTASRSAYKSSAITEEVRIIPRVAQRNTVRRSTLSVIEPAANPTTRLGTARTAKMTPTMAAEPVSLNTSQPSTTCCMPWPIWAKVVGPHNTRKSR